MANRKTPYHDKKDPQRLDAAYFLGAALSLVIVLIGAYNGLDDWWSRDALTQQRHINEKQAVINSAFESRLANAERELAARQSRLERLEKDMERIYERH